MSMQPLSSRFISALLVISFSSAILPAFADSGCKDRIEKLQDEIQSKGKGLATVRDAYWNAKAGKDMHIAGMATAGSGVIALFLVSGASWIKTGDKEYLTGVAAGGILLAAGSTYLYLDSKHVAKLRRELDRQSAVLEQENEILKEEMKACSEIE